MNLLFDTAEQTFYVYKYKGVGDMWSCSPLLSPAEVHDISPENLIDLNSYISKHFEQNSGENRDVFGQNSGGFRANFCKTSNEIHKVSKPVHVEFALGSGLFSNKNDKILFEIRKVSAKIQSKTASKRAKSTVKAKALENNAVIWHAQNDTEELQLILKRLHGLMGAINNLKTNVKTAQLKKKRNRFWKIAIATGSMALVILFGLTISIKNALQKNAIAAPQVQFKQVANVQQVATIDTLAINQFIAIYEQQRNCKISEWRRAKILQAVAIAPEREIRFVIDSIYNKQY
jgi:hypothetical protein